MPKSGKKKSQRRSGRKQVQNRNGAGPSDTALAYWGPVRPPGTNAVIRTVTANLVTAANFNSDNTGKLAGVLQADATRMNDWTAYSNLYQEFRVLAFSVRYVPGAVVNTVNGTNQAVTAPIVYYPVRDGVYAALTSYTLAFDQEGSTAGHTARAWSRVIRMNGAGEATWFNTATYSTLPGVWGGIGYYAEGLLGNAYIGTFFQDVLVQFRARQ